MDQSELMVNMAPSLTRSAKCKTLSWDKNAMLQEKGLRRSIKGLKNSIFMTAVGLLVTFL
jgi:hypothetical protein